MDVKAELRAIARQLDELLARRDQLILTGLTEGERPTDLGRAAGLSRARIYQIKGGQSLQASGTTASSRGR